MARAVKKLAICIANSGYEVSLERRVSGGLDPRDFGGATRFSVNAISADDR
jgi:hypothetical protein